MPSRRLEGRRLEVLDTVSEFFMEADTDTTRTYDDFDEEFPINDCSSPNHLKGLASDEKERLLK